MASRQWERALAWKEISPTSAGLEMGLGNRIVHPSGYRGALGAASHGGTAPAMVCHAEMSFSSFLGCKQLMSAWNRGLLAGRHIGRDDSQESSPPESCELLLIDL